MAKGALQNWERVPTQEIITALIGGVVTLVSVIAKAALDKRRHRKATIAAVRDTAEIKRTMRSMLQPAGVDQVLIFKTHNGGGRPSPGSPLKVSSLHLESNLADRTEHYTNIMVDAHYVGLMVEMLRVGSVDIVTVSLPQCLIRTVYREEGVKFARWYHLATSKAHVYFISVSTTNPAWNHHADFEIETGVAKLRSIYSHE